tara:strand:+ start:89 stop:361 length:273 start_codon:yes stop_codon:yes gene_type:complete
MKNITLKNEDTLNITLPNGNVIDIYSHDNISNITIQNRNTYEGSIKAVKITNFRRFNSVSNWFKGGIKKVSKTSKKRWINIGNDITLYKN